MVIHSWPSQGKKACLSPLIGVHTFHIVCLLYWAFAWLSQILTSTLLLRFLLRTIPSRHPNIYSVIFAFKFNFKAPAIREGTVFYPFSHILFHRYYFHLWILSVARVSPSFSLFQTSGLLIAAITSPLCCQQGPRNTFLLVTFTDAVAVQLVHTCFLRRALFLSPAQSWYLHSHQSLENPRSIITYFSKNYFVSKTIQPDSFHSLPLKHLALNSVWKLDKMDLWSIRYVSDPSDTMFPWKKD